MRRLLQREKHLWPIVLSLLLILAGPARGEPVYRPALLIGTQATYMVSGDPLVTENVVRSELTVTSVVGTNVTIRFVDHYVDGSPPENNTYSINVATGQLVGPPNFYFAISGGLGPMDALFSGFAFYINYTETRRYAGVDRLVNVLAMSGPSLTRHYYWDKSTGLLAGVLFTIFSGTEPRASLNSTLTSTNAWSSSAPDEPNESGSSPIWALPAILLLLLIFGTAVLIRRRRPRNRMER